MSRFADYAERFRHVRMERRDGVLELYLHTDGDSLAWGGGPHEELGECFHALGADPENEVIILTGTGDEFIARMSAAGSAARPVIHSGQWAGMARHGRQLLMNLLEIEAPMIAAVNGPARIHAELALLCDIVLAADTAVFQDAPHFPVGIVPGDGTHVVWPLLLGTNRARYFLLTGQELCADTALELGLVNEVLAPAALLDRARALAHLLLEQPALTRRHTRLLLTQPLKRQMLEHLGYGLSLEGLALGEPGP